jgi:hypothetical protein
MGVEMTCRLISCIIDNHKNSISLQPTLEDERNFSFLSIENLYMSVEIPVVKIFGISFSISTSSDSKNVKSWIRFRPGGR